MESKIHCDILTPGPFSGFQKSQLNRLPLLPSQRMQHSQMSVTSECLWLYFQCIFDYSFFLLFKNRSLKPPLALPFFLINVSLPLFDKAIYLPTRHTQFFFCVMLAKIHFQFHLHLRSVYLLKLKQNPSPQN